MPAVVFVEVSLCKWYRAGRKSTWSGVLKIWFPRVGWVLLQISFSLFLF